MQNLDILKTNTNIKINNKYIRLTDDEFLIVKMIRAMR